jgi:uncharacterized protein (DUF433 family)
MSETLIIFDLAIMAGKPVLRGTRITVELVLEKLAQGESVETIPESYPHLTRETILAVTDYAVKVLKSDTAYTASN